MSVTAVSYAGTQMVAAVGSGLLYRTVLDPHPAMARATPTRTTKPAATFASRGTR
jgi:hypothetical protein